MDVSLAWLHFAAPYCSFKDSPGSGGLLLLPIWSRVVTTAAPRRGAGAPRRAEQLLPQSSRDDTWSSSSARCTHHILCHQRAAAGSRGSPTTRCNHLQPAQALIWGSCSGDACEEDGAKPVASHLPPAAAAISLQLLLRHHLRLNSALSIFRGQPVPKHLSLREAACLNRFQAGVWGHHAKGD